MAEQTKEPSPKKKKKKSYRLIGLLIILALVLFILIVMWVNSIKPKEIVLEDVDTNIRGAYFIKINQVLIKQMYENWLPNDIFWPTALLDNMPNFQLGELEVVRYNVRIIRDNLSRMRTTDKLDPQAEAAFTSLSNDPHKFWFPSAESKWKNGYKNLDAFYQNVTQGKSHFYPRADNLIELLSQYASLMGGANTRLILAPGDIRRTLAMEELEANSQGKEMIEIDIPWHKVDNNFYYAQGIAYALYHSFKAIKVDFERVLIDKNSMKLVDQILENLKRCDFEPLIVFNGDPDSIFANHSLNLSGVFNDARQKINSLIVALDQG
jgi:hypothetical protein